MAKKIDLGKMAVKVLALSAGGATARFACAKMPDTINPLIKGGIVAGVGVVLPMLSPKTEGLTAAGDGMIAVGVADAITNLLPAVFAPSVSGIGSDLDFEGRAAINGDSMQELDAINGTSMAGMAV